MTTTFMPSSAARRAAHTPLLPPPMTRSSVSMVFVTLLSSTVGASPNHAGLADPSVEAAEVFVLAAVEPASVAVAASLLWLGAHPANMLAVAAPTPASAAPFRNDRRETPRVSFMIPS